MNLTKLLLLVALAFSSVLRSQTYFDGTNYQNGLSFDTILSPDYYEIVVGVREYENVSGKRKNQVFEKVDYDQIRIQLQHLCDSLSSSNEVELRSLWESSDYDHNWRNFVVGIYATKLYQKTKIDELYKILENRYGNGLRIFVAKPVIEKATIESISDSLEVKSYGKYQKQVERFSEENGLQIKRCTYYKCWVNFNFAENRINVDYIRKYDYSTNKKHIDINYGNIPVGFNTNANYELEKK